MSTVATVASVSLPDSAPFQSLDPTAILHTATGFWASKVLLTAVDFDLFSTLATDR